MTHVLLLRHGSTDLVATHLCGRTPGILLNEEGRQQAQALAGRLSTVDLLITSPIDRARETAELIAQECGLAPCLDENFAEFDFGEWTGRSFDDLRDDPGWQRFNEQREIAIPPGGESMLDVQRRARNGLRRIIGERDGDRRIAIVSHGDVIRAVLLHALEIQMKNYRRLDISLASISEIAFDETRGFRVVRLNDTAHLERRAG